MSTPFQLLPTPSALRWADVASRPIRPVWSPWPPPTPSTLKRSNAWAPPTRDSAIWTQPNLFVDPHLDAVDAFNALDAVEAHSVVEASPSWWRRSITKVSGFARRLARRIR